MEMVTRTNVGCVRDLNEDSTVLQKTTSGYIVAVVADGMGGHNAGDVASKEATSVICDLLMDVPLSANIDEKKNYLLRAVERANESIYNLSSKDPNLKGMGTTVIASLVDSGEIVLAHVGDSRAYILKNKELCKLTTDHSYVEFLKEHGQLTDEEAKSHPQRNMILRAVGTNRSVEIDLIHSSFGLGETLLLCTDGLTTMLSEEDICKVLNSDLSIAKKADNLIEMALSMGGKDNISIILIENKN